MGKKKNDDYEGDFGWTKHPVQKDQVVGIFDLVGFSSHRSNDDLVAAVAYMDSRIKLGLGSTYVWAERQRGGWEADRNEVLLRSTGDGYAIAFSQDEPSFDALQTLLKIYKGISSKYKVNLGINRGQNYVVTDVNDLVNIIGWGINYAARALQFAKNGQIICTEHFSKGLLKTEGIEISDKEMVSIGKKQIKEANIELYNYYRQGKFGARLSKNQSK